MVDASAVSFAASSSADASESTGESSEPQAPVERRAIKKSVRIDEDRKPKSRGFHVELTPSATVAAVLRWSCPAPGRSWIKVGAITKKTFVWRSLVALRDADQWL